MLTEGASWDKVKRWVALAARHLSPALIHLLNIRNKSLWVSMQNGKALVTRNTETIPIQEMEKKGCRHMSQALMNLLMNSVPNHKDVGEVRSRSLVQCPEKSMGAFPMILVGIGPDPKVG